MSVNLRATAAAEHWTETVSPERLRSNCRSFEFSSLPRRAHARGKRSLASLFCVAIGEALRNPISRFGGVFQDFCERIADTEDAAMRDGELIIFG